MALAVVESMVLVLVLVLILVLVLVVVITDALVHRASLNSRSLWFRNATVAPQWSQSR
jgi:hypothetical protein